MYLFKFWEISNSLSLPSWSPNSPLERILPAGWEHSCRSRFWTLFNAPRRSDAKPLLVLTVGGAYNRVQNGLGHVQGPYNPSLPQPPLTVANLCARLAVIGHWWFNFSPELRQTWFPSFNRLDLSLYSAVLTSFSLAVFTPSTTVPAVVKDNSQSNGKSKFLLHGAPKPLNGFRWNLECMTML